MSGKEIYLQNLEEIERIARIVARKHRLNPNDIDDFTQSVHLRLIENDYAILNKFEGRSSVSTYLVTVIERLYGGWRDHHWGKWRPSAEAKRIGEKAIRLEELLRDKLSFEEAVSFLTTPAGSDFTRAELEWIYRQLPVRIPRQPLVPIDGVPEPVDPTATYDPVEAGDRARLADRLKPALEKELERFATRDRLILTSRYWNGLKVREIGLLVHMEEKKLFKHLEKLLRELGEHLRKAGFTKSEVADFLEHHDQEMNLDPGPGPDDDPEPDPPEGNPSSGPSHKRRGTRGGEEPSE